MSPKTKIARIRSAASHERCDRSSTGNGSKRTIPSPVSALGNLQWGVSKWIALSDQANGRTVFFVSHNLAAVQSLCTRAIMLRGGRVANALRAVMKAAATREEKRVVVDILD